MVICPRCKTQNLNSTTYCIKCDHKLPTTVPVPQDSINPQPSDHMDKKKHSLVAKIIIWVFSHW
jgi:hypothetical protein